ncbi:MAG: toll/interleukin-1 receptor domain-containing protein [Alphaproteobacteria bacterium]|nr:toll/interleukin-1 receptor domain-containing protein [Alphaproteobacteria bacterium]
MSDSQSARTVVFLSKATPGDDEFALWLAPRLEAAGYSVFADILTIEPGSRWRIDITNTLQTRAAKMLLCCSDSTLASLGVHEEIGIATELAKTLGDTKFIIPLRLEPFKKLFGIGELQYIDFVRGWAEGLNKLLEALKRQKVPRSHEGFQIQPNWEVFRRRRAVTVKKEPERLTSNWLRIAEVPDAIQYFEPTGPIDRAQMNLRCKSVPCLSTPQHRGIISFGTIDEVNHAFSDVGRFAIGRTISFQDWLELGAAEIGLKPQDASNVLTSMFRRAWDRMCEERGFLRYAYSSIDGFHPTKSQVKLGQRIPWGGQGERRLSMLRNTARGHVWQYGVSALPNFWPYPHFKLKSRVLFAPPKGDDAAEPFEDKAKQHRLRRTVCKGWRNKQWHGRMMAFVELLAGDSASIKLPVGDQSCIRLDATPMPFTSPVSTFLPNLVSDDEEEQDDSTLGSRAGDDEDPDGVS